MAGPVPVEVIRYWDGKGIRPGFSWADVYGEQHDAAFTAAKIMREDVLRIMRNEIDLAVREGRTLESFQKSIRPRLEAAGFWGAQKVVDPKTGREVQIDVPSRLRRIYDTNLRVARSAGEWERIQRTKTTSPYLLYLIGASANHRDEHVAWHGVCLHADDPWWQTHYPPGGFGCNCGVRQITRRERDRYIAEGVPAASRTYNEDGTVNDARQRLVVEAPPTVMVPWTNPRTGETRSVPQGITPGFDRVPTARVRPPEPSTPPVAPVTPAPRPPTPARTAPPTTTPATRPPRPPRPQRDITRGQVEVAASPEEAASRVVETLSRPESDPARPADVRAELRTLIQTTHPELRSLDVAHEGSSAQSLRVERRPPGVLGSHDWQGRVVIAREQHALATEGARRLAQKLPVTFEQRRAIQVHVHEEMHGHSPINRDCYLRGGRVVEEATNELLARNVMWKSGIYSAADVERFGVYSRMIDRVFDLVRGYVPGWRGRPFADVMQHVVDASVRLRSLDRFTEADKYVSAFVTELGVPDRFAPIVKRALELAEKSS